MCALMHVLHAIVRGTDESREMVVVLRMLLSLSHTHTGTNRRPFSHVYTTYRHLSMSHSCIVTTGFPIKIFIEKSIPFTDQ